MFSPFQFLGPAMMVQAVFATFSPKGVCDRLPLGAGPSVFPDTPEAFQAYTPFSNAALSAATPNGYVQAYSNLLATYDEPSQFVHYVTMHTYNVDQCAAECDNNEECNAFTIFFERHPAMVPDSYHCPDPRSTTFIKCDLWSGTILPSIAMNNGQIREQFQVVMAGANAYVKDIIFNNTTPAIPSGYAIEKYALGAAIEAPLDCNGEDTYMGLAYWPDGHFDAQRCISACEQTHDATGRPCHFVNTYMQRRNNVPVIQHCAMFSEYWPSEYATNIGQRHGSDEIDISETDSYGIRDITGDFSACLPNNNSDPVAPIIAMRSIPSEPTATATFTTLTRIEGAVATPSPLDVTMSSIAPDTTTYSTPTTSTSTSAAFLEGQLVNPTDIPVITDVPDFAKAFSIIATRY